MLAYMSFVFSIVVIKSFNVYYKFFKIWFNLSFLCYFHSSFLLVKKILRINSDYLFTFFLLSSNCLHSKLQAFQKNQLKLSRTNQTDLHISVKSKNRLKKTTHCKNTLPVFKVDILAQKQNNHNSLHIIQQLQQERNYFIF